MIYRIVVKHLPYEPTPGEAHFWGEMLLSYGLFKEKGIIYEDEPVIKNPWGKPSMQNHPEIRYNISHSGNCIACVISDKYEVGIDVEKVRSFNPYAAKKICTSWELERIYSDSDPNREFFRIWTLKESYTKAIGKGLSYPMKDVNFVIDPSGQIHSNLKECVFLLMEDAEGFITAVCYTNLSERQ